MWKKPTPATEGPKPRTPAALSPAPASPPPSRIGSSLSLKGDLHGDEDLVIEGSIEGKIVIRKHSVTIGETGRVDADIEAADIRVAGQVKGNLKGTDRVVLLETGRVEGNITAGSVTLENGCRFKGSIDMEHDGKPRGASQQSSTGLVSPKANGGTSGELATRRP